ncbi:MAG: hypothetical protein JWN70_2961 [Planctomycetaceae bacterium]|nr:hypothetical protein [Planctomycetaceae bacterium]
MMTTDLAPAPVEDRGASASMSELQSDAFASPELELQNEFSYRPIPVLAPVSLVIGLCSIIGLASVAGLSVPLAGVILGILGLRQISRAHGEYGGFKLTVSGLVLSSICLMAGTSLHAYTYATEVPDGYERLSFRWLAEQKPIVEDGQTRINPEAKSLDGQKVFIKGYMYPENAKTNLKHFVLCKDTGQCCFGGKPSLTDMIVVDFVNGTKANFRELSLVSVAGTFRAKKTVVGGEVTALYSLEGEYFK